MRYQSILIATPRSGLAALFFVLVSASSGYGQTLVGHWQMEEGGGTAIVDSSGSGNNGTLFGNPTWVAGKDNLALSLDGNTGSPTSVDWARIPDSASLDITGPVTLSAWVNPARNDTQTLIRKVDGTGIGTTSVAAYEIVLSVNHFVSVRFNGDDAKRVNSSYIYDNCPAATCPACPPGGCTNLNKWFHVAATYDGATIRLYINGVLDASLASAFTINNNNIDLTLGADVSGSTSRDFQGRIDDARIYNGALTADQIRSLWCVGNAGASCDDGAYCNGTDICGGNVCGHSGDPCAGADGDGDCSESCDEASDSCTAADPDGSSCTDGQFCTGSDTCSGGACTVHAGDPCVGGGECADSCDEGIDSCDDPSGVPCGSASSTACDNPDTCDGAGSCASNNEPNTTLCRGDGGECDVAEFCDGAGSCPANGFEPAGTACGDPSDTTCDDPDTCNASGTCLLNHEPNTTVCRTDSGECDVAESCDGAGSCPADGYESAGTPCGSPSDTACDDPDTCDGGGTCEANLEPATTVCRPDAGDCDVEELCDGAGACPSDVLEADGTTCDDGLFCTDADECTAGVCDGAPLDCSASGTQCRIGTCNETTDACEGPAKPDGTVCDDDDDCTIDDECTAGECGGQPDDLACLDHFSCYKSKTTLGFAPVAGITLVDAFWASTAEAKKPKWLCTPADRGGTDSTAPSHPDHLESYQIKPTSKFAVATGVQLQDYLGTTTVTLTKPANLLVPTAKSLVSAPSVPAAPIVDNFQCYKVKVTASNAPLPAAGVTVEDQFGEQTAELRKLKYACVPVNKNNEEAGAETHTGYLTCYQQKSLPKFVKQTPVYTANQLASETMDVIKPFVLCLPAARVP